MKNFKFLKNINCEILKTIFKKIFKKNNFQKKYSKKINLKK